MIWLALLPALMTQQPTVSSPAPQQLYERPLVRPFEPASNFGREQAQGDGDAEVWRPPLTSPVTIDAYRHSYEVSPTDKQIAYEQAVAQSEIDYDDRMGPLDGSWHVIDPTGQAVLSLVMSDPGLNWPVEGAWLQPPQPGRSADLEVIQGVTRDLLGRVAVSLGEAGLLSLNPAADGQWVGIMSRGQDSQAVVVRRPG